jgi:hypothetical protein
VVAILVVWPCRVVCLSGVNAAANWRRHHLITFLNCATQLLYPADQKLIKMNSNFKNSDSVCCFFKFEINRRAHNAHLDLVSKSGHVALANGPGRRDVVDVLVAAVAAADDDDRTD